MEVHSTSRVWSCTCLRHEHKHPEGNIAWSEDGIYDFYRNKNWGKCNTGLKEDCLNSIRSNITEPLSISTHKYSDFDVNSVMIYPVDCSFVEKGTCLPGEKYFIEGNKDISQLDLKFVSEVYM